MNSDEPKIGFHSEDVDYALNDEAKYRRWLLEIAANVSTTIVGLSYIFCSDEYLRVINNQYLQHDYYTDIITFPYQQGSQVESDIFISVDRVSDNASTLGVDEHEELLRVISHGLLHLCGYGDKSEEEAKIMRAKENECIALWHRIA